MGYEVRVLDGEMELQQAYRLRYEVYIAEIGNRHPQADHRRRVLRDDMDDAAPTVIGAFTGLQMVGTLRLNVLVDCPRDALTYHQIPETHFADGDRRLVVSMVIVDRDHRASSVFVRLSREVGCLFHTSGALSLHLVAERHNVKLYERMGFTVHWDRPKRHPVYRDLFPAEIDMHRKPSRTFYRRVLSAERLVSDDVQPPAHSSH